jgi:thiol:disulfide interchange protein DsbC
MKKSLPVLFASLLLLVGTALAEGETSADAATEAKIRNALEVLLPGLKPDSIRPTPIGNLFEITLGTRIVYITDDGRFLVQGKLIDLETRSEITEKRLSELKIEALQAIGEDQMVVYSPEEPKHQITVFTDIDCGFCRRMHAEMDQYHKQGIAIRYLFYPRAGVGSDSYKKAVSVWCADDRHAAMDSAKAGKAVPPSTCDNPVAAHYKLGQQMSVQGTPALLLEDGEIVPGYVEPARLRHALDQRFP